MPSPVYDEIVDLLTEQRNHLSTNIDCLPTEGILALINAEDRKTPEAVGRVMPDIARAVDLTVEAFNCGGRLIYVGAGTSGRLGVLDAAECLPTFGVAPGMVTAIIAGGPAALVGPAEGAEDSSADGELAIRQQKVTGNDVVVGLTASRRTPYVVGALREARRFGAKTVLVACNPKSRIDIPVDVLICPIVGPEVIAGSTRMKAGTAQKLVLNMLTTASMVRIGKVFSNLMVDVRPTSEKLRERSKRILMICTGLTYAEAEDILAQAGGDTKRAIVMALKELSREEADARLDMSHGSVREALGIADLA